MVEPLKTEVKILQVTGSADRLDKYLAQEYPELSRSVLQKLIKQGFILVNDLAVKSSQKLSTGDKIYIELPPPEKISLAAESIPVDVIYEDSDLLVICKPPGLVVHPSPGHTAHTLVNALLARCPDLSSFGDTMRPGIVHRLDRDTSGLMIIAKNSHAQRYLIEQFRARSVSKGYLVMVKGKLAPIEGIIDAPLGRDPSNRKRMAVVKGGREARTRYKVKEYLDGYTLLDITTETGRTHQIRVHLSAIGYPVIGDSVYGVRSPYVERQFVHAYRLGFCLPVSGQYREFTCEMPIDLRNAVELLSGKKAKFL
jgi:23S rRNA pseudouridine1911/1915/1917 synthase